MPMRFSKGLKKTQRLLRAPLRQAKDPAAIMSAQDFGGEFRAASRILWLIAVGIVGDPNEAEDVVQDAAMVAYRKRHLFEPGTSFRAWLGAIVRNVALNVKRSRKRRRGAVNGFAERHGKLGSGDPSQSEAIVMDLGLDARVVVALSEIADIPRACLLLRTVGELHYAEIATVLDIPEGTAMSHVHRSRAALRERLTPVWRDHNGMHQTGNSPKTADPSGE